MYSFVLFVFQIRFNQNFIYSKLTLKYFSSIISFPLEFRWKIRSQHYVYRSLPGGYSSRRSNISVMFFSSVSLVNKILCLFQLPYIRYAHVQHYYYHQNKIKLRIQPFSSGSVIIITGQNLFSDMELFLE